MKDFYFIYEKDNTSINYLICKHCLNVVERGVFNVSNHWVNCLERTEGLIIAKNDIEEFILDKFSVNK